MRRKIDVNNGSIVKTAGEMQLRAEGWGIWRGGFGAGLSGDKTRQGRRGEGGRPWRVHVGERTEGGSGRKAAFIID